MSEAKKVAIVGSGLIGRSWAMLFASVGYKVCLYDILPKQVEDALKDIDYQLTTLEQSGLLKGKLTAKQQFSCIVGTTSLKEAVQNAVLIQECVPENLDLKRNVWKGIDEVADPQTILSSSTSTFLPSNISGHLKNKKNFIISHPVNPPYYVPLVEVVPAPWTEPEVAKRTRSIMEEIGQSPVSLSKEIPGFSLNRIQYAILNEVFNQVQEGILDVHDVDKVMSDGLGMRYAFLGTLETTHLNAEGFIDYCNRYSKSIYDVSLDLKPVPKFEGPLVLEIAKQLESSVPLDQLARRRNWRDDCLSKLSLLKKEQESKK